MDRIESHYKVLSVVNSKKDKEIYLVQNYENGLFYYLKVYHGNYNYTLINRVKNIYCSHVPMIKDMFEKDDTLYVVEELINALALEYYINESSFSEEEAVDIIIQLCDIMEIYHKNNPPIVHRDLAWDNLLYRNGKVYVIDFDIARFYDEKKNKDTDALGKSDFAPPEQRADYDGQTCAASDIYTMGIIFHLLLTGMFPKECTYSGKYKNIIKKMIKKDVEDRYQTTTEVKRDIYICSGNLKGYFVFNQKKKNQIQLACTAFYPLIVIFFMEFEGMNIFGDMLYKLFFILMYIQPFLIATNFDNVQEKCLCSSNNSKVVRVIGMVLTIIFLFIVEIMIIGYLSMFFDVS